jgi:hypothetical protein
MQNEAGLGVAQQAVNKDIAVLLTSGNPQTIAKLEIRGYPHSPKSYRVSELVLQASKIMRHPAQNIAATRHLTQESVLYKRCCVEKLIGGAMPILMRFLPLMKAGLTALVHSPNRKCKRDLDHAAVLAL